jgi:hypothetical protein
MASPPTPPLVRWTGLLFSIGSALFMAGVPLSLMPSLPAMVSALTFAIGAVFFTTAAFLQILLARRELPESEKRFFPVLRGKTWDWSAATVQFVGTLLFNVNTIRAAALIGADPATLNREVWVPDALGSVLFLVSSAIAMVPEVRSRRHGLVISRSWVIAALNLLGSIFFGLSAIGAYILVGTGEVVDLRWANGGTFLGGLCFLIAAVLFGFPPKTRTAPATTA